MLHSFLILAEPKNVFNRIAADSPWFAPLAYCTGGFFIITWLGGCWTDIRQGLQWWSLLGPAIASTLFIGMAGLGSTAAIYVIYRIIGGQQLAAPMYRSLFSLNIHCAVILVLGELFNFLLVRAPMVQDWDLPLRNRFPLGLDVLLLGVKEPNIYLTIFLHSTSVFVVWYLLVLAAGLKYTTGLSSARSAAIAATVWLLVVGLVVGIVYSAGGGTVFRITM